MKRGDWEERALAARRTFLELVTLVRTFLGLDDCGKGAGSGGVADSVVGAALAVDSAGLTLRTCSSCARIKVARADGGIGAMMNLLLVVFA